MKQDIFLKLPEIDWDGESPVYSDTNDTYYNDLDDAECNLEENETLEDLQLLACKPEYVRPLDDSYCEDQLDPDIELPPEVQLAMDEFNQKVKGIIISWFPSDKRIKLYNF